MCQPAVMVIYMNWMIHFIHEIISPDVTVIRQLDFPISNSEPNKLILTGFCHNSAFQTLIIEINLRCL